eukprot:9500995-Pyramimonas_sp.AAC.1
MRWRGSSISAEETATSGEEQAPASGHTKLSRLQRAKLPHLLKEATLTSVEEEAHNCCMRNPHAC